MCGICGIYSTEGIAAHPRFAASIEKMKHLMLRRGPDDDGTWVDARGTLTLGFRRLAILDLSPAANQPMVSGDRRSAIVFNGELYNFLELRRELESKGVRFRSRSDSEVALEAFNTWGVSALERFNGMFALAWYDRAERELVLARDHAGIKPLYYFVEPHGRGVVFASQYNCLFHGPWEKPAKERLDVLHLFLRLHHIPPPYALFENTHQLEPGTYIEVGPDGSVAKHTWWSLPRSPEPDLNAEAAMELLPRVLDDAIHRQRISDVPLGVFLSGGVDSPLVTAIARQQTGPELKAFTIGNPGWWQDESSIAALYAQHLGVDFRLHAIDGLQAEKMLSAVAVAQTEPFADYSIFPTMLVSQAARTELTVALSGDGGDELFFGYERPFSLLRSGQDFRWPWPMRVALYGLGKYGVGPSRSQAILAKTVGDYYFGVNCRLHAQDIQKIAPGLDHLPDDFNLYHHFDRYRGLVDLANYSRWVEFYGQLQRGLKKVDFASMYYSLEVRVPLLDLEVINLSVRIKPFDSMKKGTRKALLRELLARYVPGETIPSEKRGFAVPLGEWLSGSLRPAVEEMLIDRDLYPLGVFDQSAVQEYWAQHVSGERSLKWGMWTLLALQLWYKAHYETAKITD